MAEAGPCAIVLLAAGGSARMGEAKQLIRVDGEPLIRRAARIALEAGLHRVFVVLGAEADRIRPAVEDLAVSIVTNPNWHEGIASSLRAGVLAIERELPGARGLIAMPADQPGLTALHLCRIDETQRARGASIVASDYGDHRGPPAFFGRRHFARLLALRGDTGARELLHADDAEAVAAPQGSDFDIDRPEDLVPT